MLAVAIETPAHGERRNLTNTIHFFDCAVALLAAHARKDVLAVIEVDEVGQFVHGDPRDGPAELNCLAKLFDFDRLLFQHAVAIHTHACRRNTRVAAGPRCGMTIETGDLVVARVHVVRKGDGLFGPVALVDTDARQPPYKKAGHDGESPQHNEDRTASHYDDLVPVS